MCQITTCSLDASLDRPLNLQFCKKMCFPALVLLARVHAGISCRLFRLITINVFIRTRQIFQRDRNEIDLSDSLKYRALQNSYNAVSLNTCPSAVCLLAYGLLAWLPDAQYMRDGMDTVHFGPIDRV